LRDQVTGDMVESLQTGRISRRQLVARASALGLSVSAIGSLLAACGASDDAGSAAASGGKASGTVRFIKGPHSDDELKLQGKINADFTKQFPDIKVDFRTYDWAQLDAELNSAFASGNPPEVMYLINSVFPRYAEQGALEDLTPIVKDAAYKEGFDAIESFAWDLITMDGKIWGIPVLGAVFHVYVNNDLLKQAGAADWNSSYDAMRSAAQKMTKGNTYGFAMHTEVGNSAFLNWWDWFPYMHNAGATLFNDDVTAAGFGDNPDAAKAQQLLIDIHQTDKSTPPIGELDREGMRALFRAGRIGILHEEAGFAAELRDKPVDFKWDVALAPPGPKGQTAFGDFGFLSVPSGAKNKQAAFEFIKFWAAGPQVKWFAQQVGLMVVQKDTADMYPDDDVLRRIQTEFVPKIKGFQSHPKIKEVLDNLWPPINASYRGKTDGATALKQAAEKVDATIA
jgi:ABC-type glycerol-3-phosphate transport system substrate-binding protein